MNSWIKGLLLWACACCVFALPPAYGPTTPQEYLWHLALAYQKDTPGTSVQQSMYAQYTTNPQAFKNHNTNGLLTGFTLRAPDTRLVKAISTHASGIVLARHNQAWKHGGIALVKHAASWPFTKTSSIRTHLQALDKRITSLGRSFESMQTHLDSQYGELSHKAKQVQLTLAILNNDLAKMHRHDMQNTPHPMLASLGNDWGHVWTHTKAQWFAPNSLRVASAAAFLLVLMMIWMLWAPTFEPVRAVTGDFEEDDDGLGDEYNFMSSEEGIPARLDLARAYIDMDDIESARSVLQNVLSSSTENRFSQKAKDMMSSLDR